MICRDGEPYMRPTVCMAPHEEPEPGNVFIKDYSENEGIMQSMIDAGLISKPVRTVKAGFAEAHECRLEQPLLNIINSGGAS